MTIAPANLSRKAILWALAAATSLLAMPFLPEAAAQTPPPTVWMRGTLVTVAPTSLTFKNRSGEVIELVLPDNLVVNEVYPMTLDDIKPGSYIGTAAMPQADGTQRAIGVSVFPETARGAGEGHRPFDLQPQSTMTNATVADVSPLVGAPNGRALQLKYKDGEKTVVVSADTPIVTSRPADRSLLVPGASVSLFTRTIDGKPTAVRISAGRNGFLLPY